MRIRHYAQRQHIIDSLDGLLYQLHVLSYFMAPSLLVLAARCFAQLQIARPRAVDGKRGLRFWYGLILLFNVGTVYSHAAAGAPEGRAVVLDFIGMAVKPSKAKLVCLDVGIIFLSYVLATISFEASYIDSAPEGAPDTLAAAPSRGGYEAIPAPAHTAGAGADAALVLDLRLAHFWKHIRRPPPPLADDEGDSTLLPLPATSAALPRALRALMHARAARTRRQAPPPPPANAAAAPRGEGAETRRVPGAMDDPD